MPLINNAASYITLQITTRHQKLRRHFSFPKNCLHWARLPMWQRYEHSRVRKNHLEKQVVHSRITSCIPSTANSFTTLKQEICTSNHCFNSIPKLVLHFKSPEPLKSLRHVGKQAWQKWKTRKMVFYCKRGATFTSQLGWLPVIRWKSAAPNGFIYIACQLISGQTNLPTTSHSHWM